MQATGREGDPSYMNVEGGEYDYIDADVVVPKDGHQYEQLRHMGHTSGMASTDPNSSSRRQQSTPVQPAAPAGCGTQNHNNCFRRPPCWGWVLLIIGLVVAATVVAILAVLLSSPSPTNTPGLPATTDMTTVRTATARLPTTSDTTTATQYSIVGTTATTPASLTTATPIPTPKACQDVYNNGGRTSGVYTIYPDGVDDVQVYCEQELQGGGWTVFQRRIDGTVNFYRGWDDYRQGLGSAGGEYWIGNDHLHQLTAHNDTQLLVELEYRGETVYAPYTEFWVLSERLNYELHVAGYTGGNPPGDSLAYGHNGRPFSTQDRDNDDRSSGNCAQRYSGAWWYGGCYDSNLNGLYNSNSDKGVTWWTWKGLYTSLSATRMMVKPR